MAILKLYTYPHKILSQKCEPYTEVTDEVRKLLDDMLETMYEDKGVGLAGPQIGVAKRINIDNVMLWCAFVVAKRMYT